MSQEHDGDKKHDDSNPKSVYDKYREQVNERNSASRAASKALGNAMDEFYSALENVVRPAFQQVHANLKKAGGGDVQYKTNDEIRNADGATANVNGSKHSFASIAFLANYKCIGQSKGKRSTCRAEVGAVRAGKGAIAIYATQFPVNEDRLAFDVVKELDVNGLTKETVKAEIERALERFF